MKKGWGIGLLMLLVACTQPSSDTGETNENGEARGEGMRDAKVLAEELDVPWSVVESGDVFYISERPGAIAEVPKKGGKPQRKKLSLTKEVLHEGEGGFLGLALSPDFDKDSSLYAYHTYRENGEIYNRIVRLKETEKVWKEEEILLEEIPGGFIHNGGRLAIGPDQKLYATAGDAGEEEKAQDRNSLAGKILRLNLDGSVPEDNPFPDSYVYSYGHRNPQGLAWTDKGVMYSAEHGPSGDETGKDEINRIEAGKNYGWPVIVGDEEKKGMESPLYQSGEDTWAPSGLAESDGTLYVAGLRGQQIRAFSTDGTSSRLVFEGEGRLRDILSLDGRFYVLTNNTDGRGSPGKNDDRLLRLDHLK
ncbi:PQQ-dependent sugar dehydrogenase [Paludifilum halophilum]|uniref:Quinoprotein glucose dehydrogenase n=1 Tax=Paludifilum halophilum TaxID=1642702 RepID=A0A235B1K6_9BACL|nr:PQQ-dependent sugar dehydrogenase [Paludifilum halophilum]OYD06190.1 quinoprotein glucose dehydrogenase [Paludifilum halophilum]